MGEHREKGLEYDYGAAARRLLAVLDERAKRKTLAAGVESGEQQHFEDAGQQGLELAGEEDGARLAVNPRSRSVAVVGAPTPFHDHPISEAAVK